MFEFQESPVEKIESIRSELQAGFKAGKLKTIAQRKAQLLQLGYLIKDNIDLFREALKKDLGRPELESNFLEINPTISEIKQAYDGVGSWSKTERAPFHINFFAMSPVVRKEPKGTVLVISPFNYPLLLSLGPVASAIAAGCTVVLKPSELSSTVSGLFGALIPKYMDSSVVQVVNGAVSQATKLLELQWDHILYTGGNRVAKVVALAAAKFLTPVTLELGGKSPVVIDSRCDLKTAAKRIVWGKMANAGQTCVAPDYILVENKFQDKLVAELKEVYKSFYPEGGEKSQSFGRIISPGHFERIAGLLKNSKGTIVAGGETDAATKYIAPTIVKDVKPDDSLMSEELFGPVLPIMPVANVEAAISYINSNDHPLALYVFSGNSSFKSKVFDNTQSGAAIANECVIHVGTDGLPFGGIGPSGNGSTTGKYGFDVFTQLRCSLDSPSWLDILLSNRFPPYTSRADKMLGLIAPSLPSRQQKKPDLGQANGHANGTIKSTTNKPQT